MGRTLAKVLAAVLVAAALAGILWAGNGIRKGDYVYWNGSLLPSQAQHLDVSGKRMRNVEVFLQFPQLRSLDARDTRMTAEQYEWFCRELPDCRVLWDIPIQKVYYSQDTTELTVKALTDSEIASLRYLPELERMDLGRWTDYDRLKTLRKAWPELDLSYQISLGNEWWDSESVSILVNDPSAEELLERLPLFPKLESVMLTGIIPEQEELTALQAACPQVFFLWKMEVFGQTLETDMTQLDLSGTRLKSVKELDSILPYFPAMARVDLGSCGLPQRELVALAAKYPGIHFLFDVTVEGRTFRTDIREMDLSDIPIADVSEMEALLHCFHNLEKVDMCGCGIPSAEMDELNRRHEDIRFVWSVNLGGKIFRTDAVHFTPNRWGLSLDNEDIYDLRYCTDMVCVDIGHNMKVTNCEWAAFMPNLKYLVLAETGISDLTPLEGHENLIFLELFLSKVTDYSPLLTCKALEDLNLCYTSGDPAPVGEMTWLKRLWWSGSWLARTTLEGKLPNTYTEYLSISSTGRGWREGQHYYDMRDFIGMKYMVG